MAGFGPKMIGNHLDVYLPKNPSYSDRLLYLMAVYGWTQMDLAKKSGVAQTSISNYLYKGRIPKLDIAAKIAVGFGVSLDWMAGLDGNSLET